MENCKLQENFNKCEERNCIILKGLRTIKAHCKNTQSASRNKSKDR